MRMIKDKIKLCVASELLVENIFQVTVPNSIDDANCQIIDGDLYFCYSYQDSDNYNKGNPVHHKKLELGIFYELHIKHKAIKRPLLNSFIFNNMTFIAYTSGFNKIK